MNDGHTKNQMEQEQETRETARRMRLEIVYIDGEALIRCEDCGQYELARLVVVNQGWCPDCRTNWLLADSNRIPVNRIPEYLDPNYGEPRSE